MLFTVAQYAGTGYTVSCQFSHGLYFMALLIFKTFQIDPTMKKDELLSKLFELAELNQQSNPKVSAILFTLVTLCLDKKENVLLHFCDFINDIYINQLKNITNEK